MTTNRGLRVLQRLTLSAVLLQMVVACSPMCRLKVKFVFPGAAAPVDEARLHLSSVKLCPPGPLGPAGTPGSPTALADAAEYYQTEIVGPAAQVVAAFRGKRCSVRTSAWYDRDANGKLNTGDLTGTSIAVVAEDRGIFRSNMVAGRDVHMLAVP